MWFCGSFAFAIAILTSFVEILVRNFFKGGKVIKPGPSAKCFTFGLLLTFYIRFVVGSIRISHNRSDFIGLVLEEFMYVVVGLGIGRDHY